jgi:hypothetical protein
MLEEDACKGMLICAQPTIAIEALLTLRSLLDSQPLLVAQDSSTSGASSLQGGPVESAKATAVTVRRTKTRTSGSDPTALS